MKNKSYHLNYLFGLTIFIALSIIFLSFGAKTSYAGPTPGKDTVLYLCNLNSGTRWEVQYSYFNSVGDPLLDTLYVYTSSAGSPAGCTNGAVNYAGDTISNYVPDSQDSVKWNTSCVDPTVPAVVTSRPEGTLVYVVGVDVTCKQGTGQSRYAKCDLGSPNNLGSVAYASACPITPACTSNCSSAGARQCTGGTSSQTCQDTDSSSAVCLKWVTTDNCTSGSCDNATGYCRHNGCDASNTCVWFAGDGANGCPGGSSDCTTGGTTCIPGNRQCIGSCGYQVCNSTGTAWGSTLSCPANSACVFSSSVGASCQASAGSCTAPTPTPAGSVYCQQCLSGACSSYTTSVCSTNCSGCSGTYTCP